MSDVRGVERCSPAFGDQGDAIMKDVGWCEEGEPCVMVMLVVPGEEILEPRARVEVGRKPTWIVGLVLERFELGFAERVVVRYARTTKTS